MSDNTSRARVQKNPNRSTEIATDTNDSQLPAEKEKRRGVTVYDAVAGRIGRNGFLTTEQLRSERIKPLAPEEVLLRKPNAPDEIPVDFYSADKSLVQTGQQLPDSDLLKDVHAYVADFYNLTTSEKFNYQSFDETALLAMGVLLEEACRESLGENGDMVFTEPQYRDQKPPESKSAKYQVIGRVVPKQVHEYQSSSESEDITTEQVKPRKRQRRRHQSPDE